MAPCVSACVLRRPVIMRRRGKSYYDRYIEIIYNYGSNRHRRHARLIYECIYNSFCLDSYIWVGKQVRYCGFQTRMFKWRTVSRFAFAQVVQHCKDSFAGYKFDRIKIDWDTYICSPINSEVRFLIYFLRAARLVIMPTDRYVRLVRSHKISSQNTIFIQLIHSMF